jgi:hypothetical protein
LNQAIHSLPSGLGTIDSVVAKSEHSRIEATFDTAAEYSRFFRSFFMVGADASHPQAPPLFSEHGGVFAPYKEVRSDGKFHAVLFVDRPHQPPMSEARPAIHIDPAGPSQRSSSGTPARRVRARSIR